MARGTPHVILHCAQHKKLEEMRKGENHVGRDRMGAGGSGFIFISVIYALGLVCYCFRFSLPFLLLSLGFGLHCLKDLLLLVITIALVLNHNSFWVQCCWDILGPLTLILPDPSYPQEGRSMLAEIALTFQLFLLMYFLFCHRKISLL